MSSYITDYNLVKLCPESLLIDENFSAVTATVAIQLQKNAEYAERAVIFARIDSLPEYMLDILAYDFRVDWYASNYSIDEKRRIIKNSINVHMYSGTKYAVESALQSIYPDSRITEWFEYGGKPFNFKVIIYDSTNDSAKRNEVVSKIKYYKNVRSILDEVIYQIPINGTAYEHIAVITGFVRKKINIEVKNYGME